MVMNKKEKAALEAALTEAALRRTSPVQTDVAIPQGYGRELSTGWLYAGEKSREGGRVSASCSSSIHHAFGRTDATTTQNARRLFSTKLLALQALRYATEEDCCKQLRRIDRFIEAAAKAVPEAGE